MDLLMTGASGFVGSHMATRWLLRDPGARIACLVRAPDEAAARVRLHAALRRALHEQDLPADPDPLLARATALRGDMADPAWTVRARDWMRGPTEVFHCAADLSFREADRARVWDTNVEGTRALLAALADVPGIAAFNHVSTAYVAGDRQGTIGEDERAAPAAFNNPYEESKWTAEGLVRAACEARGLPWRVFRPSIIIAHSETHRMSSQSGFYQVAEVLMTFGRQARGRAEAQGIVLPLPAGTTLDLIPVDVVVGEMLALMALGDATANRTFHVTSDTPLPLADVLRELTPVTGVAIGVGAGGPGRMAEAARGADAAGLVMRRLRHYLPYFSFVRRFERRHAGLTRRPGPARLDVEGLRGYVDSFLRQRLADAAPTRAE